MPSWAMVDTRRPEASKTSARAMARPPVEEGESWTNSSQSPTSTSRWNHWAWSRVARLIPSLRQLSPWLRSAGSSMTWSHM